MIGPELCFDGKSWLGCNSVAHNCDEVQLNEIFGVLIMLENNITLLHAKLFYSAESKGKVCLTSNK